MILCLCAFNLKTCSNLKYKNICKLSYWKLHVEGFGRSDLVMSWPFVRISVDHKCTQQTFVDLQDVLKTSSARLQRNNFSSSKTSWRLLQNVHPSNGYLLKVNGRNFRERCKIWSKLTIKTQMFLLLTLNNFSHFFRVSIVDFEKVNFSFVTLLFLVNIISAPESDLGLLQHPRYSALW